MTAPGGVQAVVRRPLRVLVRSVGLAVWLGASTLHAQTHGPLPPPATTPTPTPPPTASSGADWVALTLVTDDKRAALYAKLPGQLALVGSEPSDAWEIVCSAPCGKKVDPRRIYRVIGEGLEPSNDFNLAPGAGALTLAVDPHLRSTRTVGAVLGYAGLASMAFGGVLIIAGVAEASAVDAANEAAASGGTTYSGNSGTYLAVGATMLATGALLDAVTIVIFLTRTTGLTPVAPPNGTRARERAGVRAIPGGFAF